MGKILIKNPSIAGKEAGSVAIVDGLVAGPSEIDQPGTGAALIDAAGLSLMPGFIDVHCHGAVGVDVNEADAGGLFAIADFLARHGVTAWMPTLVPDSDENYRKVVEAIDTVMESQDERAVAQVVGVHYEGVFANEKMCGALRPEFFKIFTGSEVAKLPRLKRGVHMMTVAPEVEGGIRLVSELRHQGWVVSIGHTRADINILDQACDAGARHLTHFFNAMTGLHHRNVGVVGWGLTRDDVTFDIIADGVHVDPNMLGFACRTKRPENVSLISDSVAPTGLGDGEYQLWGEKVIVENGKTRNERGSIAGSVITMLDAVVRMRAIGFSDDQIILMSSANPAKLLGLSEGRGSLDTGKRADMVALNDDGELKMVMIGGRMVGT
jgi:N-acetylglucosamine-6-phosphate deacetylase